MQLEQAVILDLGDLILVRGHNPAIGDLVAETFLDANLPEAMQAAIYGRNAAESSKAQASALRPTGYEDFLRALGYRLDRQFAEAFVIVECPRYMHVSGMERIGSEGESAMVPFCYLFEALRVNSLVNEAVARRKRSSMTGGLSAQSIDAEQLGRVMHSSGLSR